MTGLTIALPKGRLLSPALTMLERSGLDVGEIRSGTRKLILEDKARGVRFLLLKPFDVVTFVEYGAADVGIVGQDVLLEQESEVLSRSLYHSGTAALCSRARRERAGTDSRLATSLRIASKYPRITRKFFVERGRSAEIIPLHGSVEIAPALGLADLLVDIVDTGRTLQENGLVELDTLCNSQATLIVNRSSHALRYEEIAGLMAEVRAGMNDVQVQLIS